MGGLFWVIVIFQSHNTFGCYVKKNKITIFIFFSFVYFDSFHNLNNQIENGRNKQIMGGSESTHHHHHNNTKNTTTIVKQPDVQVSLQVSEDAIRKDPFLEKKLEKKLQASLDDTEYYKPGFVYASSLFDLQQLHGHVDPYDKCPHRASSMIRDWLESTKSKPLPPLESVHKEMVETMPGDVREFCFKHPTDVSQKYECKTLRNMFYCERYRGSHVWNPTMNRMCNNSDMMSERRNMDWRTNKMLQSIVRGIIANQSSIQQNELESTQVHVDTVHALETARKRSQDDVWEQVKGAVDICNQR